jgi:hypothetical protein
LALPSCSPFLGVSSLNFGPLVTVAFFLRCSALAT